MLAEEAASRFYAELLAQHERDRAARAAAADYEIDEDELLDLDERIPFLVCLPDHSLHAALLDEELSHRAPGAVNAVHLPARLASYDARGTSAAPLPQPDEPVTGQVDLQTAFISPPSSGDSSSPPPPQLPIGTLPTAAASADPPPPDPAREAPLPPAAATPPDSVAADRATMSQRLWRLGSAVFTGAGDAPDADLPPNVIWTIVAVPPSLLPTALTTAPERTATLRGSLWKPTRSFHHQLSGALGLNRAESAGSSRSMFGRSHTEAPGDSTVHIPMHMHPEVESSDEGSEEESAGIAAAYPEGMWPESSSPRRCGRSGRFQYAPVPCLIFVPASMRLSAVWGSCMDVWWFPSQVSMCCEHKRFAVRC